MNEQANENTTEDTSSPKWAQRAREGIDQLEVLWGQIQKYQKVGYERARESATELQTQLSKTLDESSERFAKVADEVRKATTELSDKLHSLFGSAQAAAEDQSPPDGDVTIEANPISTTETPAKDR